MQADEKYMLRCLELASLAGKNVKTNPLVAAVIVHQNHIIGEGYHQKYGEAHAEVNAIHQVFEKHENAAQLLQNSTLYVNLEPCAHFGKTPPCADLIIKHQIPRVVIANIDPFENVNGKGIEKLINAGIEVITGVLEQEGKVLNKRFFCKVQQQRPYIILKWAETQNGFFAPDNGKQQWISGQQSKVLSHQWRSEEDAILVGFQTAKIDNPQLNVRLFKGENPIRILIDKDLQLLNTHHLLDDTQDTIVFNARETIFQSHTKYIEIPDFDYYLPQKILYQLYIMDVQSLIIEGGKKTLETFIQQGLWDEARVFRSKNTTWPSGLKAPQITHFTSQKSKDIGDDILTIYQK